MFAHAVLDRRRFPLRGIVCSLAAHTVAFGLLVPVIGVLAEPGFTRSEAVPDLREVVYLPVLGGGAREQGLGEPQAGDDPREGLSYPGVQPVLSEFPDPTHSSQTVLRPALEDAGILDAAPELANIVQFADRGATVRDEPSAPDPAPADVVEASLEEVSPAAIDAGVLDPPDPVELVPDLDPLSLPEIGPVLELSALSVPPPMERPALTSPELPAFALAGLPASPPMEPTEAADPAVDPAPDLPVTLPGEPAEGTDNEDLLVLSPTPGTETAPPPSGEALGVFAVSTVPNPESSEVRPGSRVADPEVATEERERPASLADFLRSVNRAAAENAAVSTDNGGTGEGPGEDIFPGVTILAGGMDRAPAPPGGSETPGSSPLPDTPAPEEKPPGHLQQSYGVAIITTERSGGGLPDFGVFSDEQVHTVFFDMRRTIEDRAPVWTVEYGVPRGTRVQVNPAGANEVVQGFLLPFPVGRAKPLFPPELVARYRGRNVIAYAVIDAGGELEQVVVRESPDDRLVGPVLEALEEWTFRPASLDGRPVPVKMLLGIPVSD